MTSVSKSAATPADPVPSTPTTEPATPPVGISSPILAGVVTAIVGFTSAFTVVLAGLKAVGASDAQAASGLFVVCMTMGAGCMIFSFRYKMPITMAWSTPGAALLAAASIPTAGYASSVGAFILAGLLILATGLIKPLGRWVAAIPSALANAMLAGVLLTLCVQPFSALAGQPAAVAPVVVSWLLLLKFARRWAVPGAFLVALIVIVVSGALSNVDTSQLAPTVVWTSPTFDISSVVAISLPLFLVTMTSQNIPGIAVLASFGYRPPVGPPLIYTGGITAATGALGGFAINLGALSAAIAAGPTSHPDPSRRWIAGVSTGAVYWIFGPLSAAVAAISLAAPAGVIPAIAGLALIGAFANAGASALSDPEHREAAAITFLVAASGVSFFHVGAAFWALIAGGIYLAVMRLPGLNLPTFADRTKAGKPST